MSFTSTNRISLTVERTLCGHKAGCTSIAFNPSPLPLSRKNSREEIQLISASLDHTLTLWQYNPKTTNRNRGLHSSLTYDGCQQSRGNSARAYRFIGHSGPVHHVCYSQSGQLVASCSADKTVRLWVPNARGESVVLNGHSAAVRCVDFSHSSSSIDMNRSTSGLADNFEALLVTCSDDKTVKIWNLPQKTFRCSLLGHTNWVRTCKFSPDTSHICGSGGDDGSVRLWDVERNINIVTLDFSGRSGGFRRQNTNVGVLNNGLKSVRHLEFHPSATSLAASTTDGIIELYDLRCDKVIQHYNLVKKTDRHQHANFRPQSFAPPISFHPSGQYMLCGGGDNLLDIWDVRKGTLLSEIKINSKVSALNKTNRSVDNNSSCPSSVIFSTNGNHFACTGSDKEILIWNSDISRHCDGESISRTPKILAPDKSKRQHHQLKTEPQKSVQLSKQLESISIENITPELEFIAEDILDYPARGNDKEHSVNFSVKDKGRDCRSIMSHSENGMVSQENKPTSFDNKNYQASNMESGNVSNRSSLHDEKLNVSHPSLIEGTLEQVVGQLTIITRTLELLDRRLSAQEDAMENLMKERTPNNI